MFTLSIEEVRKQYESHIIYLLDRLRAAFHDSGWAMTAVEDFSAGGEYVWHTEHMGGVFHVDLTIVESINNDGEDDLGINFSLKVCGAGGEPIEQIEPYNHTDHVWVSRANPHAIAERFNLFRECVDLEIDDMLGNIALYVDGLPIS